MYSWIWRKLPGSRIVRIIQAILLMLGSLALLYFFVYPWLDLVVFPETENRI